MKFFIQFLLLGLLIGTTNLLQAQNHLIKLPVANLLRNHYGIHYEQVITPIFTIGSNFSYLSQKVGEEGLGAGITKEKGFSLTPEIRLYLFNSFEEAPTSFFVGGNVSYERTQVEVQQFNSDTTQQKQLDGQLKAINYGLVIGQQWLFSKHFSIELLINPYYRQASLAGNLAEFPILFSVEKGIKFNKIDINVAYVF